MLRRRRRHLLVAVAVLAFGLGLVAALDTIPSWQPAPADQISALQPSDQTAIATPDRRVTRVHLVSPLDTPLPLVVGASAALAALVALTGSVRLRPARRVDRRSRHLAWVLRSPPTPARALIPVR